MFSDQRIPNTKCILPMWQRHLLLLVDATAPGSRAWAGFQPCSHSLSTHLLVQNLPCSPHLRYSSNISWYTLSRMPLPSISLYLIPTHPSKNQDIHLPTRSFHLFTYFTYFICAMRKTSSEHACQRFSCLFPQLEAAFCENKDPVFQICVPIKPSTVPGKVQISSC